MRTARALTATHASPRARHCRHDDENAPDCEQQECFAPPYVHGELRSSQKLFEDDRWERAYAARPGLKTARMWGFDDDAVKAVEERIAAEWAGLSASQRRAWEEKERARAAYAARYEAAQLDPKGGWSAPALRALMARCPNVHTLRLDFPRTKWDTGYTTRLKLTPADGLLRAVCDAWGANLRLLHLAGTRLSVADLHDVLARSPRLRWLGAGYVALKDADGALFRDMPRHASLRSIVLPVAARKHLTSYVARLCARCPALREIDANVMPAGSDRLVADCARRAAAAGVRRFMCLSFFEGGGSDGEWGSDGGSVGEYCGDGNVIKYVAPGGGGGGGSND